MGLVVSDDGWRIPDEAVSAKSSPTRPRRPPAPPQHRNTGGQVSSVALVQRGRPDPSARPQRQSGPSTQRTRPDPLCHATDKT
jgi:hypothetical protein